MKPTLLIRMALYAICAGMAGYGLGSFDAEAGTLTLQIDRIAEIAAWGAGYIATFIASRYSEHR